jgi:hypothetical protein
MSLSSIATLSKVFGGKVAAASLLYLRMYENCYAKQIADCFKFSPSMVQKQLDKFEVIGVLNFSRVGKTKVYSFNPKSPLSSSIRDLLGQSLGSLDETDFTTYFNERRRPRRQGKPLWIDQKGNKQNFPRAKTS